MGVERNRDLSEILADWCVVFCVWLGLVVVKIAPDASDEVGTTISGVEISVSRDLEVWGIDTGRG